MNDRKDEQFEITASSGNVFADIGIAYPDEYMAKVKLAHQINKIIKKRKLKQKAAAEILGIDQPKVSALNQGRLSGFSIERLISFLNKLEQNVEIIVTPNQAAPPCPGHLTVGLIDI